MPSPSDVAVLRQAHAELARLADRDLAEFFRSLDLSRPERARDDLLEFVPALTTVYGDAAATVAADWYDEVRASDRVPGRFTALMAAPFAVDYVQARVRFGARHLFTDTPDLMLPFLSGAVQEYTLQPGRDTVQRSAIADPAASGWRRVPQGETCNFCLMLAARGAVYRRESVTFAAHGHCDCTAAPSWDPDAPEVPAEAYMASERMGALRRRAAAGDESAQRQLEENRRRVREYIARMGD